MDRAGDDAALWRLTFQNSPIGMALVALDGTLEVVNGAMCRMLGYESEDLRGKRFHDVTHPEDHGPDVERLRQALDGRIDSFRLRKRYLRADGSVMWGDLSSALVRCDETGRPQHFVSQLLDVTEEHAYEERLAEANRGLEQEQRTLAAIFDTVDVGLLLIDRDGNYQRMNRRHSETMGLPFPDGHRGRAGQLGEVFEPDGRTPMARESMPSHRATLGEEFDDLRLWVGREPSKRAFSVSARTMRDEDGRMTGAALAYKDVTDLMRALQVKDDFVAGVSHELRTPLTSVLGRLELLLDEPELPEPVRAQLEVVERNAERLRSLVADLLHVATEGEGGVRLELREADLVPLVREAADTVRGRAEESGIRVDADLPGSVPARVDPGRIRQVVDHLLSNAVKYTEAGGTVTVSLAGDPRDVRLEVRDTGLGLEPGEAERAFDRFFRGAEAVRRHLPGTGLGLAIVRSVVTAHGGEVTLESEPGEGATVRVRLAGARPADPGPGGHR